MGRMGVWGVGIGLLVACSSSDKDDTPACQIAGTYSMTTTVETQSEGCSVIPPDDGTPSVVTVNASGGGFTIETQGLSGACPANAIDACKLQAKCDVVVSDATGKNPPYTVTLQFSWTFDAAGFSGGINSGAFPVVPDVPKGCNITSKATGARR